MYPECDKEAQARFGKVHEGIGGMNQTEGVQLGWRRIARNKVEGPPH